MCGICGTAGFEDKALLKKMCDIVAYRGPDDKGYFTDTDIGLGNRRLSIIDIEGGHQPIHNEDESMWVVCNGEIYNYKELRKNLERGGHHLYTNSDTEVIVHLYEEEGDNFLKKLNGMFGLAVWDGNKKRLLLARDPIGIKPLHYYFHDGRLIFSSEIKSILLDKNVKREVNLQSLHYLLNLRYIPGEETMFKGIKRLLPAHFLTFENNKIKIRRYWDITTNIDNTKPEDYYVQTLKKIHRESVERAMISDVPVGAYISGGIDSGSVVAIMSELNDEPIQTFGMGFNEPTDEVKDASFLAEYFETDHHELIIDPEPFKYLPEAIWHADEPKVNLLQGFLISKFASKYVKVVNSGMGGDELFAGYLTNKYIRLSEPFNRFVTPSIQRLFCKLGKQAFIIQNKTGRLELDFYRRGIQLFLSLGDKTSYYLIMRNVWDFDNENLKNIYSNEHASKEFVKTQKMFEKYFEDNNTTTFLDQALIAEIKTKLPEDFLLVDDRLSMANSLEMRVPLLDKELVEFSFTIPSNLKFRGMNTKYIFKKAMKDVLPRETLQKKKWGFAISPYHQFTKDLKEIAEHILNEKRIKRQGYFNYGYIKRILDHQPHRRLRWHYFHLWLLTSFEIWHQIYIEDGDVGRPRLHIWDFY